jgi:hypothetical protein
MRPLCGPSHTCSWCPWGSRRSRRSGAGASPWAFEGCSHYRPWSQWLAFSAIPGYRLQDDGGNAGARRSRSRRRLLVSRARRARGAGWAWPALVWIVATALVGATVLLQVVVRPQLASDPLVGGGRLDAPASAQAPGAVLPGLSAPSASVDAAALARTLEALPRDGLGDLAGLVVDAETGTELYRVGSGARTPGVQPEGAERARGHRRARPREDLRHHHLPHRRRPGPSSCAAGATRCSPGPPGQDAHPHARLPGGPRRRDR